MPSRELLFIDGYDSPCDYSRPPQKMGSQLSFPPRNRTRHGKLMCSQWRAIWAERDRLKSRIESDGGGSSDNKGCYIDFNGAPGYDLKVESLESRSNGIALSNVTEVEGTAGGKYTRATVFLPEDKKDIIGNKFNAYLTENISKDKPVPKNNDLVSGIESMSISGFDSFWADAKSLMPQPGGDPIWCEVWLAEPEMPDSLWPQGSASFDML